MSCARSAKRASSLVANVRAPRSVATSNPAATTIHRICLLPRDNGRDLDQGHSFMRGLYRGCRTGPETSRMPSTLARASSAANSGRRCILPSPLLCDVLDAAGHLVMLADDAKGFLDTRSIAPTW